MRTLIVVQTSNIAAMEHRKLQAAGNRDEFTVVAAGGLVPCKRVDLIIAPTRFWAEDGSEGAREAVLRWWAECVVVRLEPTGVVVRL